jgi:hypothetical protein
MNIKQSKNMEAIKKPKIKVANLILSRKGGG